MKDAYSFDRDEAGLDKNYQAMYEAYKRIFSRCGLEFLITQADSGVMGGKVSHEFMVPAKDGEDVVLSCAKCGSVKAFKEGEEESCPQCSFKPQKVNTIEVGHIFKLGTKYSLALGANFLDSGGKLNPIIMGCYGIGVSRLISAVIEQNNDPQGIVWPVEVAPYKVIILPLELADSRIMEAAEGIYKELADKRIDALLDDRDERPGVKFKDAELIGIPLQIVIGKEFLNSGSLELNVRRGRQKLIDTKGAVMAEVDKFIHG